MSLLLTSIGGSVAGGGSPSGPLPSGTYWQNGTVTSAPDYGQGWTAFTAAIVGSGATITVLEVNTSRSIATWDLGLKYKGTVTDAYKYYNGATYSNMTNTEGFGFLPHVTYSDDLRAGTFSGVTAATAWIVHATASDVGDGNIGLNSSAIT